MDEVETMRCRGCGGGPVENVVDLGEQTGSDHFPPYDDPVPDGRWPLGLWLCHECALVQLGPVVPQVPEPVRAVESETSKAHAATTVAATLAEYPELVGGTVREFASHHGGSWLEHLTAAGCRPAGAGEPARLVVDVHGIAHEPDVGAQLQERVDALADDGLLVLEFHHLLPLVTGGQFDTIRHGHWSYFSLTSVSNLTERLGLKVVGAVAEPVFGGSLRVILARADTGRPVDPSVDEVLAAESAAGISTSAGLRAFADGAQRSAAALRDYLKGQRDAGRRVLAYGAPSKASVLLGVSDVRADLVPFTVDASPAKHGLSLPGVRIPIRSVEELVAARPDVVLILTWDIADEVVGQLEAAGGWGAEYVVPLPEPHRL
jgi:hypothetical protein